MNQGVEGRTPGQVRSMKRHRVRSRLHWAARPAHPAYGHWGNSTYAKNATYLMLSKT